MTGATGWEPLLTGGEADRALEVAAALAAEVRQLVGAPLGVDGPYLAGGSAGLAVLSAWWGAGPGGAEDVDAAEAHLDAALEGVAESDVLNGDLYAGVLGVGWALDQIDRAAGRFDELGDEERDDEVLAAKLLSASPWPGVHDLTRGLAGIAIHALEGLPRPSARHRLGLVVERLAESARHFDDGTAWWTTPDTVLPERAEVYPDGYVDLGVAHGLAGVLAALAAAGAAGDAAGRPLAVDAARYLSSWQLPPADDNGSFPGMVVPGQPPGMSRVAWCYGDAGAAWALVEAGRALGDDDIVARGVHTARTAGRRPFERTGCIDAGLCHGAAGIAHSLNRVAQATGDDEVANAARHWIGRTLDMRHTGEGLGGFTAKVPDWGGTMEMVDRGVPGLLEGIAGIALALLSAATAGPPAWDRFLLPQLPRT
jgi:hypothetical protein